MRNVAFTIGICDDAGVGILRETHFTTLLARHLWFERLMPAIFAFCILLAHAEVLVQPAALSWRSPMDRPDPTACFVTPLPQARRIAADVYCGGEPSDEAAFARLRKLGVQTIVSVDGATPAVRLARQFGMRYVHIPIGYDGIPASAQRSLARVARELERPLYVHCHHGRHRGPAAAAVVCLAMGVMDKKQALRLLEVSGTSHDYDGLWRSVETCRPLEPARRIPNWSRPPR